jgi:dolichol-phosphate mannosyltransferase
MILSVVIPCYNEEKTIEQIVKNLEQLDLGRIEKQLIIVDDGSGEQTISLLKKIEQRHLVVYLKENKGKGFALRKGFKHVSGDIVIIQDADLEYDVNDYTSLIKPIVEGRADVVYGSRFLTNNKENEFSKGVKLLTKITNLLYGTKLTDEATCYKVFRSDILKDLDLRCERFEFCPEVTAKISKKNIQIKEIPINYNPRTRDEGKKIKFKDGIEALWTLVKYRFL